MAQSKKMTYRLLHNKKPSVNLTGFTAEFARLNSSGDFTVDDGDSQADKNQFLQVDLRKTMILQMVRNNTYSFVINYLLTESEVCTGISN